MNQKIPVIGVFLCILELGCASPSQKQQMESDVFEQLREELSEIRICDGRIMLADMGQINNLTISEIAQLYGEPYYSRADTFLFGEAEELDDVDHLYHDPRFRYKICDFPQIIFRRCEMTTGLNKGLSLYYIENVDTDSRPIWGYAIEYSSWWLPLESSHLKDLNIREISSLYGDPIRMSIDTFCYGEKRGEFIIQKLKDKPEEFVRTYIWSVDSTHELKIYYLENEIKAKSPKPLMGLQYETAIYQEW